MSQLQLDDLQILLIEPSAMQRKVIMHELAKERVAEIDAVASMQEALRLLDRSHPDLIISALYYDDGSADQLLEKIRCSETMSDIPFMLISSERRRAQLEVFKQSGVIAILPKPFTHDHLRSALNATLDLLDQNEVELAELDISSVRTLVVDDSRLARRHIMRVLQNLGIRYLTEACDGKEAIALLQRETVDLVVTDYNMPEVNGAELTEYIRQSPLYAHLPVLMVTSEAQDAHLQSIRQSGVDALADKPFEPETVKRLLIRLMNRH